MSCKRLLVYAVCDLEAFGRHSRSGSAKSLGPNQTVKLERCHVKVRFGPSRRDARSCAQVWESWVPSYLQQRFEEAKQSEGPVEKKSPAKLIP